MLRGLRILRQQGTRLTMGGDHQRITRTRGRHIQQRTLLLQRGRAVFLGKPLDTEPLRQNILADAHQQHVRELEAFRPVHRHHGHLLVRGQLRIPGLHRINSMIGQTANDAAELPARPAHHADTRIRVFRHPLVNKQRRRNKLVCSRLKNEMYCGKRWQKTEEFGAAIAAYIEFYNNHRIKVSLNGMSIARYSMAAVV